MLFAMFFHGRGMRRLIKITSFCMFSFFPKITLQTYAKTHDMFLMLLNDFKHKHHVGIFVYHKNTITKHWTSMFTRVHGS